MPEVATFPAPALRLGVGFLRLDVGLVLLVDGSELRLTPTEVALLEYLAARLGETVSEATLLREVWGYHRRTRTRTVITTVHRLRRKLELDPGAPRHLLRRPGGYLLLPIASGMRIEPNAPVGRVLLRARIAAAKDRVVTLVGPGGVGKSYVARAVARDLGVPVISAECFDGASTRELVVLDGCDDVIAGVRAALEVVWVHTPGARVLATCRSPLGLPGERLVPVLPLELGDAVQLLCIRAERRCPGWGLGADAGVLEQIVARLDRLPVAIELAACRARVLDPEELLERLTDPLGVLDTSRGTCGPCSISAVWAPSWERLNPEGRIGLCRLATVCGEFDAASAEALLGVPWALDALDQLIHHALLLSRRTPSGTQFRMLETVRAWALQQDSTLPVQANAGVLAWR